MEVPTESPYEEGTGTPPAEAWYTDISTKGHPPTWVTVTIQSLQEEFWYESGVGQSSQWAELQVMWVVLTRESGQITVGTDSWAVFRGLTVWLPQWAAQDWEISHRPPPHGDK